MEWAKKNRVNGANSPFKTQLQRGQNFVTQTTQRAPNYPSGDGFGKEMGVHPMYGRRLPKPPEPPCKPWPSVAPVMTGAVYAYAIAANTASASLVTLHTMLSV